VSKLPRASTKKSTTPRVHPGVSATSKSVISSLHHIQTPSYPASATSSFCHILVYNTSRLRHIQISTSVTSNLQDDWHPQPSSRPIVQPSSRPIVPKASSVRSWTPPLRYLHLPEVFSIPKVSNPESGPDHQSTEISACRNAATSSRRWKRVTHLH